MTTAESVTKEDVMLLHWLRRFRFGIKTLMVLVLGIAIGLSLNVWSLKLLTGLVPNEAYMTSLPEYTIAPPDVLNIEVRNGARTEISGQRLVGPDGAVSLGAYGQVVVAGMTVDEAREAIKKSLAPHMTSPRVRVGIFAYNSKVYYVVVKNPAAGDQVYRLPITGNETVLDAVAQVGGVPAASTRNVWIGRPSASGVGSEKIMPVNWQSIVRGADTATNYQLLPGDRLIISRTPLTSNVN